MNAGHAVISEWGLSHLEIAKDAVVLDIGCGGGANIGRLLRICPEGRVYGIDYSEESIAVSRKKNSPALGRRCDIRLGSVSALPYADGTFDAAIAFETIYFWPDIVNDLREVSRILRPDGTLVICNDACDPSDDTWTNRIDGMNIYSKDELERLLSKSGFKTTGVSIHKNGWLCITAKRESE
jgi:ubiquinone/menaquinone biosynthesis C-methylase UbiE